MDALTDPFGPKPMAREGLRPLDARWEATGPGSLELNIRIPLRRETVNVDKHVVVVEEIAIRVEPNQQSVRMGAQLARERLRVGSTAEDPSRVRGVRK